MRVAVDTSIFRRDPRLKGGGFEALARFAEAGYVDVVIPEVVAREFMSLPTNKAKAEANLRKALSELRHVTPEEFASRIDAFATDVAKLFEDIESAAETIFKAWTGRTRASLVSTGEGHAQRVLARYFDGEPPFRSRKSREDFPDAFIVEILTDLAIDDELLVVTADQKMAEALRKIPNMTVFEDLKKLLESAEFDEVRGKAEADNLPRLLQLFSAKRGYFGDALESGIANLIEGSVEYKNPFGGDKEDLFIEMSGQVVEWALDIDDAEYIGEGVISLSFEAIINASIEEPIGSNDFPWGLRPSMEAMLNVEGACSLIMDPRDLADPATHLDVTGVLDRTRLEVDELHYISIKSTERDAGT